MGLSWELVQCGSYSSFFTSEPLGILCNASLARLVTDRGLPKCRDLPLMLYFKRYLYLQSRPAHRFKFTLSFLEFGTVYLYSFLTFTAYSVKITMIIRGTGKHCMTFYPVRCIIKPSHGNSYIHVGFLSFNCTISKHLHVSKSNLPWSGLEHLDGSSTGVCYDTPSQCRS